MFDAAAAAVLILRMEPLAAIDSSGSTMETGGHFGINLWMCPVLIIILTTSFSVKQTNSHIKSCICLFVIIASFGQ